jgi:hypothetical protein
MMRKFENEEDNCKNFQRDNYMIMVLYVDHILLSSNDMRLILKDRVIYHMDVEIHEMEAYEIKYA